MAWDWGRMGAGAAGGAATGAAIGSVIPGVGTAIGAGVGGVAGLFAGTSAAQENERAQADRQAAEKQRNSALSQLSGIAQHQQGWLNEDRTRRNSMLSRLAGQVNPYGQGNAGMQNLMALQQGSIRRNFAEATEDTRRALARRGALGSAQETSALRQLALDGARARSGGEAQLLARNYDLAQGYETQRNNQLAALLGMYGGDTGAGIYQNMAHLYQQDAHAAQARGDQADQMLGGIMGSGLSMLPYLRGVPQSPLPAGTRYSGMDFWG